MDANYGGGTSHVSPLSPPLSPPGCDKEGGGGIFGAGQRSVRGGDNQRNFFTKDNVYLLYRNLKK